MPHLNVLESICQKRKASLLLPIFFIPKLAQTTYNCRPTNYVYKCPITKQTSSWYIKRGSLYIIKTVINYKSRDRKWKGSKCYRVRKQLELFSTHPSKCIKYFRLRKHRIWVNMLFVFSIRHNCPTFIIQSFLPSNNFSQRSGWVN